MISEYLNNKYTKAYDSIISTATVRGSVLGYSEIHHIIPKSLGGSNRKENLVKLTPKEHFICHRLLPKLTNSEGYVNAMHRPGVKEKHAHSLILRSINNRTTCPHCDRTFTNNTYARFHGDKCKDRK